MSIIILRFDALISFFIKCYFLCVFQKSASISIEGLPRQVEPTQWPLVVITRHEQGLMEVENISTMSTRQDKHRTRSNHGFDGKGHFHLIKTSPENCSALTGHATACLH
ncbi:hypothetical protein RRG08_017712 [Elysia crispata]|uniref:Uncharacterized protein n=1 Tax=Elysia crispata TaxID=231223 RepID=A0AAE0YHR6_9GAST|nr:hypothetical protein RRG08_017712 [Elysia crispata]